MGRGRRGGSPGAEPMRAAIAVRRDCLVTCDGARIAAVAVVRPRLDQWSCAPAAASRPPCCSRSPSPRCCTPADGAAREAGRGHAAAETSDRHGPRCAGRRRRHAEGPPAGWPAQDRSCARNRHARGQEAGTPIECGGLQASAAMRRLALEESGRGAGGHLFADSSRTRSTATAACSRMWSPVAATWGRHWSVTAGRRSTSSQAIPAAAGLQARREGTLVRTARVSGSNCDGDFHSARDRRAQVAGGCAGRPTSARTRTAWPSPASAAEPLGGGGEVLDDPGHEVARSRRVLADRLEGKPVEQLLLCECSARCGRSRGARASAARSHRRCRRSPARENARTRSSVGAPGRSGSNGCRSRPSGS